MGTRNTTQAVGFLGALSVGDDFFLPLQHPAALAAVCVLHRREDRAKVSLQCKSSADLHRQEYLHIHPGVAGPVLPGMFPPKLVAKMRLVSAALDNMHGLAMESTPKLRTRYNEPCYCLRMKMASGTVKCWPETILLGTSSWHKGMGNEAGNFASRMLLGAQLFFPFAFLCLLCSWSWFLQELLEPLDAVVPGTKRIQKKASPKGLHSPRYNRRFALTPSESCKGWRVKKAVATSVFISIPLASQGQRTGTQERWNETEIKD